jgi:hypothetical protein
MLLKFKIMVSQLMVANQLKLKSLINQVVAHKVQGKLLLKVVIDQAHPREIQEME